MPIEDKVPVKATHSKVARFLIGQGVVINNVNDRTNNIGWISCDSVKERL